MMREKTKQTSWILEKRSHNQGFQFSLGFDCHSHKDDKEDDALKAEELGEGVDEEVDDEEAVLDGQHRLVASKREFHLQIRSFGSISTFTNPPPEKLSSSHNYWWNSESRKKQWIDRAKAGEPTPQQPRCGPQLWLTWMEGRMDWKESRQGVDVDSMVTAASTPTPLIHP